MFLTALLIISAIANIFLFRILVFMIKENDKLMKSKIQTSKRMSNYINRLNTELECEYIIEKQKLKEAVKFAMLQAHPDNPNGSKEKFIRYKDLYDSL